MIASLPEDVVVKVGGSLFDLPDFASRLRAWVESHPNYRCCLVPGGGASADLVRQWDRLHGLGEDEAHWLALKAMTFNGDLLRVVFPGAGSLCSANDLVWRGGGKTHPVSILNAHRFCLDDEVHEHHLPHAWEATSDALAARVAVCYGVNRLVLLKSTFPPPGDWAEAGFVDPYFFRCLRNGRDPAQGPIQVEAVNLRAW